MTYCTLQFALNVRPELTENRPAVTPVAVRQV